MQHVIFSSFYKHLLSLIQALSKLYALVFFHWTAMIVVSHKNVNKSIIRIIYIICSKN